MKEIFGQQQEYYNARAAEYDEWWLRIGRYDRGADENGVWFAEQELVRQAFAQLDWSGDVLEIAGGTGIWTEWLAPSVRNLTVLDGSAEMIAINRNRVAEHAERVTYQQLDLFAWEPQQQFDGLFMGYFLSHVPEAGVDAFLAKLAAALRPGATFAVIDGRRDARSTSPDQPPPGPETEIGIRKLNDGREFQIIKRFDEPSDLTRRLAKVGIDADVQTTDTHFLYVCGTKRP